MQANGVPIGGPDRDKARCEYARSERRSYRLRDGFCRWGIISFCVLAVISIAPTWPFLKYSRNYRDGVTTADEVEVIAASARRVATTTRRLGAGPMKNGGQQVR